jgi:hypothetical protein
MGPPARHGDHRALLLAWCLGAAGGAAVLGCNTPLGATDGGEPTESGELPVLDSGSRFDATVDSGAPVGEDGGLSTAGTQFLALTTFIHASPSLPTVRFCWTDPEGHVTGSPPFPGSGPMPEANYPGVAVGSASPGLSVAVTVGGPVDIYALDAEMLAQADAGGDPCSALVCSAGPPCFVGAPRYWYAGSVAPEGPPLFIALAGCLSSDPLATSARCGAGWNSAGGNLHVELLNPWGLPPVLGDGGVLSVQAALLSPALALALGDAGTVPVSFGASGSASAVGLLSGEDDLDPAPPASVAIGGLASFGQLGFQVGAPAADDGGTKPLWMSLADSMSLVDPTADPRAYYGVDSTYVAAIIGDPATPWPSSDNDAGTYDGTGLHVLVLPASPSAP